MAKVNSSDRVPGALWRFSLDLYARAGVAAACLALQDQHGRDVNLVLYAAWVGWSGRGRLGAAELAAAEAAIAPWRREVVAPLRALRRRVKELGDAPDVYEALKAAELEAEHWQQDRLEGTAPGVRAQVVPAAARLDDAGANLALYLGDGAAFAASAPVRLALAEVARESG